MSMDLRDSFRVSFIMSDGAVPIASVPELLARVQSRPVWDGVFPLIAARQTPINLASKIDANFYDSIGTEGDGWKGGFSGPVSRFKNHP